MRGFGGAGLAGGASADREALEIEGDDEGFGFEVIEVEVGGVGDAGSFGAVDAALFDLREEALLEAVAQGAFLFSAPRVLDRLCAMLGLGRGDGRRRRG